MSIVVLLKELLGLVAEAEAEVLPELRLEVIIIGEDNFGLYVQVLELCPKFVNADTIDVEVLQQAVLNELEVASLADERADHLCHG
jgi:hypothetical protein